MPDRAFLAGPVLDVAPALLGAHLVSESAQGAVVVRLTEVEAYGGSEDPGSHAFRGRTPRTAVMFGPAGFAYVYLSYGMHWCLNVVTGVEGTASAVLLRAGVVVEGDELARTRRGPGRRDVELARGPANLARALGVTAALGGADLCDPVSPLRLLPGADPTVPAAPARGAGALGGAAAASGPRVGVSGPGGDASRHPWRFWTAGEPSVSAYRAAAPRGPRPRAGEPR